MGSEGDRPGRVVLKIGTRLLLGDGVSPEVDRFRAFASVVAEHRDTRTVIVSSGAVAAGYPRLGMARPPRTVQGKQAAAAVGQIRIMRAWGELFGEVGLEVAQLLLTNDVVLDRERYLNARNAFTPLFEAGIVPVVNENDPVSAEDIRVGDNDNLAAYVAALVGADLLVLLTDVPGVLDRDPQGDVEARLIHRARSAAELRRCCFRKVSSESVGGMATKLDAAARAASYGISTVITNGMDPDAVKAVYEGRPTGTRIDGWLRPLPARRHWMLMQSRTYGRIVVDEGAARAITRGGTSLLACGVVGVLGRFRAGDVVSIADPAGVEWGRGIAGFDDRELERIRGRQSGEIEQVLGYRASEVVVRADKMVLMASGGTGT